jgi:RND superfamily putative drug exporter
MRAVAAFSIRHKWVVVAAWLFLAVTGALTAGTAVARLDYTYSTPGQPGYEANLHVTQRLGIDATFEPTLAVLHLPAGLTMRSAAGRAAAGRTFAAAARPGVVTVTDYANTGNRRLVTDGGHATWAVLSLANPDKGPGVGAGDNLGAVLRAAAPRGASVTVTGFAQLLAAGGGPGGVSVLAATAIGGALALLLLLLVYGSAIAVVPLLMAVPAIGVTFLCELGLTHVTAVSYFVEYLVALVGLGVAVDYSLLVVVRWREERGQGLSNEAAIRAAADQAGKAVLLSGTTVAIGLLSLILLPVPFLRSIGIGTMLIPLVAIAAAVTLLPVTLAAWGPALDRVRFSRARTAGAHSRGWERWGRLVVRRRWLAGAAGLAVMLALAVPGLSINTAEPLIGSLPQNGPAAQSFRQLEAAGMPSAADFPIEILTHGGPGAAREATAIALNTPGVWTVLAPGTPAFRAGADSLLTVIPEAEGGTAAGRAVVTSLRMRLLAVPGGAEVGGSTAADMAFTSAVYGNFPLVLAVITLLSLLILIWAFRSILLAVKAVLLNLVSLGAAFGFMVLFWQQGHGSDLIYGTPATAAIRDWIPVVVFACLFGLSMDYEVFVLSRIREEYDRAGSTDQAVITGLARTGRLVTCAAVIVAVSFLTLSSTPNQLVRIVASALAVGILLDAVIVRTLLVPALISLMGRWNWWLPAPLDRLLQAGTSLADATDGSDEAAIRS